MARPCRHVPHHPSPPRHCTLLSASQPQEHRQPPPHTCGPQAHALPQQTPAPAPLQRSTSAAGAGLPPAGLPRCAQQARCRCWHRCCCRCRVRSKAGCSAAGPSCCCTTAPYPAARVCRLSYLCSRWSTNAGLLLPFTLLLLPPSHLWRSAGPSRIPRLPLACAPSSPTSCCSCPAVT